MAATREGRNAVQWTLVIPAEAPGAGQEQARGHRGGRAAPGPRAGLRPGHRGGRAGLPGGAGCGGRHGRRRWPGASWPPWAPGSSRTTPERGLNAALAHGAAAVRAAAPRKRRRGAERRSARAAPRGIGPGTRRGRGIPPRFSAGCGRNRHDTCWRPLPAMELRPAFGTRFPGPPSRLGGGGTRRSTGVDSVRQDVDTGDGSAGGAGAGGGPAHGGGRPRGC